MGGFEQAVELAPEVNGYPRMHRPLIVKKPRVPCKPNTPSYQISIDMYEPWLPSKRILCIRSTSTGADQDGGNFAELALTCVLQWREPCIVSNTQVGSRPHEHAHRIGVAWATISHDDGLS